MQFTPQQLVGAGRYAPSTRIGNWNEDLMLEEARLKEFTLRKAQGSLLATHTRKAAFLNQSVPRSFDPQGFIHFNHVVQLKHSESKAVLACNIFEESPSIGSNEYLVTAISSDTPVSRNTFRLISPKVWKEAIARGEGLKLDLPGEPLRYDEPFLIMCHETLLADDKSVLLQPPLFLKSGLKTERSMSPITYKQRVWLSTQVDSSALWTCTKADLVYAEKLLAAGQLVEAGDRIAIVHKMTGQALHVLSSNKQATDFGVELEVSTDSVKETGRRHHLVAEMEGMRMPDTEATANLAANTWTFTLAPSRDEAPDPCVFPRFASAASVLDVLQRCFAAASLFSFGNLLAALVRADDKGRGYLTYEEAKRVIHQHHQSLPLRNEQLDLLFDSLDKRKTGSFPVSDLLKALRVPIDGRRRALVDETFDRLIAQRSDGKLTLASVCEAYDPSIAQQVAQTGTPTAYHLLWPNQNEKAEISRRDFMDVYSDISMAVADDAHFEQLLAASWR